MNPSLLSLFKFTKLSSGRRLRVFREMRKRARERSMTDLVAFLDQAIVHEKRTHELNRRWRTQGRSRTIGGPDIGAIDGLTDQSLTSLRDMVVAYIRGALPGDVKAELAERVRKAIFPDGVSAITSLPYVEELAALELILDALRDELQVEVSALGLTHMVERLTTLFEMYQSALDAGGDHLWFRDVKAARERGHVFMLEAVSQVLGRFFREADPSHAEARAELLEPVLEQDQAMRDYLRSRRKDRGTGGEVDGDIDVDIDPDGDGELDDIDMDAEPVNETEPAAPSDA